MSEKKTIVAATKISADLDARLTTEAKRLRLERAEFIRRAIEEKLSQRDITGERLEALELLTSENHSLLNAIGKGQQHIAEIIRGKLKGG